MRDDITLYGLYCYDPSILTDLDLPEGIDEEELRFHILDNAGMLFPYHQVLPQLGISIHHWFSQNKENFARIIAAVNKEYNPIENYDRTEDRTLKTTGSSSNNEQHSDSHTESGSHSGEEHAVNRAHAGSETRSDSDTTTTNQRAADNSEAFMNTTKEIGDANSTGASVSDSNGSADTATSGSNSLTHSGNAALVQSGSRAEDVTEKLRVHGNIGVTTNQQMVSAEIDLRRYNIYEDITNRFTDKFLYGVW